MCTSMHTCRLPTASRTFSLLREALDGALKVPFAPSLAAMGLVSSRMRCLRSQLLCAFLFEFLTCEALTASD